MKSGWNMHLCHTFLAFLTLDLSIVSFDYVKMTITRVFLQITITFSVFFCKISLETEC